MGARQIFPGVNKLGGLRNKTPAGSRVEYGGVWGEAPKQMTF